MVQVPAETAVTVLPETVHTAGVVELKLTASPEVATAVAVYVGPPTVMLGAALVKLMLWFPFAMLKICVA